MHFRCYIPFARNIGLLNAAINSVIPQIEEYSTFPGKKIVVVNDSEGPIDHLIERMDAVEIYELPYRLKMSHALQCNWMIRDAIASCQPFCMSLHSDAELLPGAMKDMLGKYEQIKDSKWGMAFGAHGGHIFCISNLEFFQRENVWYDPFLFPFYYMDNHMYRIMNLRGWVSHTTDTPVQLVEHVSSHYLKEDDIFRRKNDIAFGAHGAIYARIWGGLPGAETSIDPYASGTLTRN